MKRRFLKSEVRKIYDQIEEGVLSELGEYHDFDEDFAARLAACVVHFPDGASMVETVEEAVTDYMQSYEEYTFNL